MKRFTTHELRRFTREPSFDPRVVLGRDPSYPRITVVTPSFNQGRFLERTILSVLNQNYPNLEYIVIDGGSTDETLDVIYRYEPYLEYWTSERDRGQSDALNKGFARATGDIIGWQNSDDIYLPGAFVHAAEVFTTRPQVTIAFSHRIDINEDEEIIGERRFTPFFLTGYWYDGQSLSNQAAFWRRDLFARIGYLEVELQTAMDYEYFLRAGLDGAVFLRVKAFWGALRRHPASKANTLWAARMGQEVRAIDLRHGKRFRLSKALHAYALVRRSMEYLAQGDAAYLARGLIRRGRGIGSHT